VSYGDTNLRALINISVAARIELPSINPTPGHPSLRDMKSSSQRLPRGESKSLTQEVSRPKY